MMTCQLLLWRKDEYQSPTGEDFTPFLYGYLHGDENRNVMVIVPGGAYMMVAVGESEIVAKRFYEEGFDAYVLVYTCALFEGKPIGKLPLKDLAKAVSLLRNETRGKLVLCGFSAGGHLTASFGVHWDDPEIAPEGISDVEVLRPDAEILCYPVISTGKFGHKASFNSLFGSEASDAQLCYASAEKHVSEKTPPSFLWHTVTDEEVSVENTLLYADALKRNHISHEVHLFSNGPHGYSLANEEWAAGKYGGYYAMEQFFANMQYHIDAQLPLADGQPLPPMGTDFRKMFLEMPKDYLKAQANPAVQVWPALAMNWLRGEGVI